MSINAMFDTNVFNHLLDEKISRESIPHDWEVYATHIQRDEILKTKNEKRREELLAIFSHFIEANIPTESQIIGISQVGGAKITGNSIPTESAVWDVSDWDGCKWSAEDSLCEAIRDELDKLGKKDNNIQDALIAETAIKNGLILVTNDGNLKTVVERFGGKVMDLTTPPSAI